MTPDPIQPREEEARIIRALERLRRNWPSGLMLASMGGTLHLMRTDEMHPGGSEGVSPDASIWFTSQIPNTGGDW